MHGIIPLRGSHHYTEIQLVIGIGIVVVGSSSGSSGGGDNNKNIAPKTVVACTEALNKTSFRL